MENQFLEHLVFNSPYEHPKKRWKLVDLKNKLEEWEDFYNFHRPHGGLNGMTLYEVLDYRMSDNSICEAK